MRTLLRILFTGIMVFAAAIGISGQNSMPAPGTGGGYQSVPYWGSPWYSGWDYPPSVDVSPPVDQTNFRNQGTAHVIGCGYDAQGVWRVLPLLVSYKYNGIQYMVNVLSAWNPWTDSWDKDVDVPAYNTDHRLNNVEYKFYVVLSTGTFYFNL